MNGDDFVALAIEENEKQRLLDGLAMAALPGCIRGMAAPNGKLDYSKRKLRVGYRGDEPLAWWPEYVAGAESCSRAAYLFADAMLAERARRIAEKKT